MFTECYNETSGHNEFLLVKCLVIVLSSVFTYLGIHLPTIWLKMIKECFNIFAYLIYFLLSRIYLGRTKILKIGMTFEDISRI